METAPLKNFATSARRELITQVGARLTAVLAPSSPERIENQAAVAVLERDIAGAGGGAKGKNLVIEKVAYTWFNRIIALRFMDANGYTGIGVVSPPRGQPTGQPEVLAEAKRGSIDPAVVSNGRTFDTITGLLNGTRSSGDAQGEAYTLLLAEYCRYWNRAMPFMFEREGDYTELLIPANLLAADSILVQAVAVLTEDVSCDVEVIGWLYQFYISERKDEVFAGFKKRKKAGAVEIPAATQLFTPHWIVRYLVENSLGRLWMLNHPSSRLIDQMDYYIEPVDQETSFLKVERPEELTIIDPACGSGHMLTYAFDLLYSIYEEEGYAPSEIPELVLTHNLYGTEIDSRAGALAAFALTMKARAKQRTFFTKRKVPNIYVIHPISFSSDELETLLFETDAADAEREFWNQFAEGNVVGALVQPDAHLSSQLAAYLKAHTGGEGILQSDILDRGNEVIRQAEILVARYSVVVTNPPYMGSKNMSAPLAAFAKENFPNSWSDLYAMFIERGLSLTKRGGMTALVTMHSWMFLSTSESLRQNLLRNSSINTLAHIGTRAFEAQSGEIVSTTAFVLAQESTPQKKGSFLRLTTLGTPLAKENEIKRISQGEPSDFTYTGDSDRFLSLPGNRIIYWLSDRTIDVLANSTPLETFSPAIQGMITGSNSQFLRLWHEVDHNRIEFEGHRGWTEGKRWAPYNKGGEALRWYGSQSHVVDWSERGNNFTRNRSTNSQFYFKEYLSWSYRSSGDFVPRYYPAGFLWDVAGSGVFPKSRETLLTLLGLLGSSVGTYLMSALNPTSTFQVENVLEMPIVPCLQQRFIDSGTIDIVEEAIQISQNDWDKRETSWGYSGSPALRYGSALLPDAFDSFVEECRRDQLRLAEIESEIDTFFERLYFLEGLTPRREFASSLEAHGEQSSQVISKGLLASKEEFVKDLLSFAVGCMFGRYSIDEAGVILAGQDTTVNDYLMKIPKPTMAPDEDNVIPVVEGDWFEDDIVARFRHFLRVAFGEQYFEENLRFVEDALGVSSLREYFLTRTGRSKFYDDHVTRYKKRPIYWLFSSPKASFNALIYMHRYTPSTVSTVLKYLRDFESKLEASLQYQERVASEGGTSREKAAALKEAERLRKVLLELNEYEHEALYPLASQQISIDLDDGVKANYPKFRFALKKIPGLAAIGE